MDLEQRRAAWSPTRRSFLRLAGLSGLAALHAACAPTGGAPESSSARAAAAPAPSGSTGGTEWDELVAAARREGGLTIATQAGPGHRRWVQAFEAAFPGITVEHQQFPNLSIWAPKVLTERQGGVYDWDLVESSTTVIWPTLQPAGALAPLRPLLLARPEVVGDQHWLDGFDTGWQDDTKQFGYAHAQSAAGWVAINMDLVREDEVTSVQDLLAPRFKGKLVMLELQAGPTFGPMTALRKQYGEGIVRQLLVEQEPVLLRDPRQLMEGLIRGRYPIALTGALKPNLREFLDQNLGKNVRFVEVPGLMYSNMYSLWHLDRAPHAMATKLFVNWFLSKDAQAIYAPNAERNSRRTDVTPVDPEGLPKPGQPFYTIGPEASLSDVKVARELLDEIGKIRG
jgi:iron(III) transport system substrate-binding protein